MAEEKKITAEDMMSEITKLAEGLAGITAAVSDMQAKLDGAGEPPKPKEEEPPVSSEKAWESLFE
mgnify:CR=1 FL=1